VSSIGAPRDPDQPPPRLTVKCVDCGAVFPTDDVAKPIPAHDRVDSPGRPCLGSGFWGVPQEAAR
jgi:hypothetical protein